MHLEPRADAIGQDVGDEEADVVPRRGVLRSRIAEADHELGLGHAELLGFRGGCLFAGLALALGFAFGSFALGIFLCNLACTLGLDLLGGRGGDDVDDERLGVGDQRDALRQCDRTGGELRADVGTLDGNGEVFGNRLDVGFDGDGVRVLGDQRAGDRLAFDENVDLDGDLLAAANDQQVGVRDAAADRVQGRVPWSARAAPCPRCRG